MHTQFRRDTLHRLEVAEGIWFRLCIQVYKCQHSMAPDICPSSADLSQTLMVTGICNMLAMAS